MKFLKINVKVKNHLKKKQKSEQNISSFFKKQSDTLKEIVLKLAAKDEISIHSICNSKFIQPALLDKGLKLPKDESMVMALVYHQHDLMIREEIKHKIEEKKQKNKRFSILLDEFTSVHWMSLLHFTG